MVWRIKRLQLTNLAGPWFAFDRVAACSWIHTIWRQNAKTNKHIASSSHHSHDSDRIAGALMLVWLSSAKSCGVSKTLAPGIHLFQMTYKLWTWRTINMPFPEGGRQPDRRGVELKLHLTINRYLQAHTPQKKQPSVFHIAVVCRMDLHNTRLAICSFFFNYIRSLLIPIHTTLQKWEAARHKRMNLANDPSKLWNETPQSSKSHPTISCPSHSSQLTTQMSK